MKIVVVGGVAGGMSAAARARRLDEPAEIVVFERDDYVSFANCGLPYHIGGVIADRDALLVQTPESLRERFDLDVRVGHEVARDRPRRPGGDRARPSHGTREYAEPYDKLVLAPGRRAPPAAAARASTTRASSRCATSPTWTRSCDRARRRARPARRRRRRLHRPRDGRDPAPPRAGGHPGRDARPGHGRARSARWPRHLEDELQRPRRARCTCPPARPAFDRRRTARVVVDLGRRRASRPTSSSWPSACARRRRSARRPGLALGATRRHRRRRAHAHVATPTSSPWATR